MFSKRSSAANEIEQALSQSLPADPNLQLAETLENLDRVAASLEELNLVSGAEETTQLLERLASPVADSYKRALHHIRQAIREVSALRTDNGLVLRALKDLHEAHNSVKAVEEVLNPTSGTYEVEEGPATLRSFPKVSVEELNVDQIIIEAAKKKKSKPKTKSKPKPSTKKKVKKEVEPLKDLTPAEEVENLKEFGWVFPAPDDCACDCSMTDDLRERGGVPVPMMGCKDATPLNPMLADDYSWVQDESNVMDKVFFDLNSLTKKPEKPGLFEKWRQMIDLLRKIDLSEYHMLPVDEMTPKELELARSLRKESLADLLPANKFFPKRYVVTGNGLDKIETFVMDTMHEESPYYNPGDFKPKDEFDANDYNWVKEKGAEDFFSNLWENEQEEKEADVAEGFKFCGECGFDHTFESEEAKKAHQGMKTSHQLHKTKDRLHMDDFNWLYHFDFNAT